MKVFKQIACLALVFVMTIGLVACTPKEFKHKKMIDFCKEYKMDEFDDKDDFSMVYSSYTVMGSEAEGGAYISCDNGAAQDMYDITINRLDAYPDCDVDKSTLFAYCDGKGGTYIGFLFTMDDEKEAEKLFEEFVDDSNEDSESGEGKGYSYCVKSGENSKGKLMSSGYYLCGKTIILFRGMSDNADFVDDFCKNFKVKSPSEIK